MATSIQLAETLAKLFNSRVSTCTNTFKQLQADNLVSKGGRGRHAARMTALDCTLLVLALVGSEHINDASESARRYSMLVARYRSTSGAYADDHEDTDTKWYAASSTFPRLGKLDASHALKEAIAEIISSYAQNEVLSFEPTIGFTIRGPQISAVIRFESVKGTEQIEYSPVSGKDMFRTIIGNPATPGQHSTTSNFLQVEKRVTGETLKALGKLIQSN